MNEAIHLEVLAKREERIKQKEYELMQREQFIRQREKELNIEPVLPQFPGPDKSGFSIGQADEAKREAVKQVFVIISILDARQCSMLGMDTRKFGEMMKFDPYKELPTTGWD